METNIDTPLTTADVPPRFLNATLLVNHVPHRALASDPRVSYALHIPAKHYASHYTGGVVSGADPATAGGTPAPAAKAKKLPLLVSIHGTRRFMFDIDELAPFTQSAPCALLTPLFPAGLDGPNDIDSFKLLRSKTLRSDLALLAILDEVAVRWPGIDTEKIFLMGFSGGGQFVHRFLYLHPERLAAASVGAPGHVTVLDDSQNWPIGIKNVETLFSRSIDKSLISQVPIQLIVGGAELAPHGSEQFWAWMTDLASKNEAAREALKFPPMEEGRLATLQDLHELWKRDGITARFDVVPGVAHDPRGVREGVLAFMQPLIEKYAKD
ncbi:alpha/beta-hydrolase [Hypoxylon rubiginosum]|uniref:Alpha/beta-hydrolase n=1 Tax=Hypoxylon rubiginosum TaxID=110542 RepID=A0ACC0CLK2_9PEZI|nr:alpha/beta-hydrolase [Hypoxylon rubiginosum]